MAVGGCIDMTQVVPSVVVPPPSPLSCVHRFPTRHFSLYFTHWDRWCGTMHPKYEDDLFCYFQQPQQDKETDSPGSHSPQKLQPEEPGLQTQPSLGSSTGFKSE